jgi:hypothetical protein
MRTTPNGGSGSLTCGLGNDGPVKRRSALARLWAPLTALLTELPAEVEGDANGIASLTGVVLDEKVNRLEPRGGAIELVSVAVTNQPDSSELVLTVLRRFTV